MGALVGPLPGEGLGYGWVWLILRFFLVSVAEVVEALESTAHIQILLPVIGT